LGVGGVLPLNSFPGTLTRVKSRGITFSALARVQFLVGELKSLKPCSSAKKEKGKKTLKVMPLDLTLVNVPGKEFRGRTPPTPKFRPQIMNYFVIFLPGNG